MQVAILLAAPADGMVHVRRRGHLLTATEFVSQLYRMLPPAPLWYSFYAAQAAVPALLRTGLSGAYLLVSEGLCPRGWPSAISLHIVLFLGPEYCPLRPSRYPLSTLQIKAQHFFERAALVALAVQQCAQRSYGSTPSAEERQEAGNCCPICQVPPPALERLRAVGGNKCMRVRSPGRWCMRQMWAGAAQTVWWEVCSAP